MSNESLRDRLARLGKPQQQPADGPAAAAPVADPVQAGEAPGSAPGSAAGAAPAAAPLVADTPARTYAQATGKPERFAAPPAPAASRAAPSGGTNFMDRMRSIQAKPAAPAPSRPISDSDRQPLAWDDPTRPAGSCFAPQEWAATRERSGYASAVVFELHKESERGLVALDAAKLDPLRAMFLDQALLIDERLRDHPALGSANAWLEHYTKEFGRWPYRVVHAKEALDRNVGLQGARMRTGLVPEQESPRERMAAPRG